MTAPRTPGTAVAPATSDAPVAGALCPMCDGAGQVTEGASHWDPLLAAAHVLVIRALERAGRRLLTRQLRGQFRDVPAYLLHTRIAADPAGLDRMLQGAWDAVPHLVDEWGCCGLEGHTVSRVLDRYCRDLLISQHPHEVANLRFTLGAVVRRG